MNKTIVVETLDKVNLSSYHLPIITVYKDPKDFPGMFLARLFELM